MLIGEVHDVLCRAARAALARPSLRRKHQPQPQSSKPLKLPEELLVLVALHLDSTDKHAMQLTCRAWHSAVNHNVNRHGAYPHMHASPPCCMQRAGGNSLLTIIEHDQQHASGT